MVEQVPATAGGPGAPPVAPNVRVTVGGRIVSFGGALIVTFAVAVAPVESATTRKKSVSAATVPAVSVVVGPLVALKVPAADGKLHETYGGRPPDAWKVCVCFGKSVAEVGVIVRSV